MVSFANCNKDAIVLSLPTVKPSIKPLFFAFVTILLRIFIAMVKRKGDRGSDREEIEKLKYFLGTLEKPRGGTCSLAFLGNSQPYALNVLISKGTWW